MSIIQTDESTSQHNRLISISSLLSFQTMIV